MGNWRTVNITGTISAEETGALHDRLAYSFADGGSFDNFGPLSFSLDSPGLCGLNNWVSPTVFACGNLSERDYTVEDVAEELRKLLTIAPSMDLKVHCGGDWESDDCIATVTVKDGQVTAGAPEVEHVSGPSEAQLAGNLFRNLIRPAH